ncbi:MAG: YdbL family protein [Nitrospira sp.]
MIVRHWVVLAVVVAALIGASYALALSLDEAKAKGLVGEKSSGYLGIVAGGGDVQSLVSEINAKRRQAYEEIAKKNGMQLSAVETLAGEKAMQNTKPGHYIEGPGGWTKK